jgi:hypothetical protein
MTNPGVTSLASVPYALKQGRPAGKVKVIAAEDHPVHKAAQAMANKVNRGTAASR